MKKDLRKYKDYFLNFFGVLLLTLGILAVYNSINTGLAFQIFWMCYISLILMGVGILSRNSFLVMSQIYILTIPLLIWNIDFFHWLIFDRALWGITDYFFVNPTFNLGKIVSLQHIYSVPLAVYCVYLIRRKRNDEWKLSLVQSTLIFFISFLFTPKYLNINCVFKKCIDISLGLPHQMNWFIIYFSTILVTAFIFNKILFLKVKK